MLIPEIVIFNTLNAIIKIVRSDFEAKVDTPERSILYKLFYNKKLERYDLFEQAKTVFLQQKNQSIRALEVHTNFNAQKASIPCIHITTPSDQNGDDGIGVDEGHYPNDLVEDEDGDFLEKKYTRRFNARFNIVVTSDNHNEVLLLFYGIRALLIPTFNHLELSGIENIKISGSELNLNPNLIPERIFAKSIQISFQYEQVVTLFQEFLQINQLIASGSFNTEGIVTSCDALLSQITDEQMISCLIPGKPASVIIQGIYNNEETVQAIIDEFSEGGGSPCAPLTWELRDSANTLLLSGEIVEPCGEALPIIAPDATYNIKYANNDVIEGGSVASGGSVEVIVPNCPTPPPCADGTAILKDTAGVVISTTPIPSGSPVDIEAPDANVQHHNSNFTYTEMPIPYKSGGNFQYPIPDTGVTIRDQLSNILFTASNLRSCVNNDINITIPVLCDKITITVGTESHLFQALDTRNCPLELTLVVVDGDGAPLIGNFDGSGRLFIPLPTLCDLISAATWAAIKGCMSVGQLADAEADICTPPPPVAAWYSGQPYASLTALYGGQPNTGLSRDTLIANNLFGNTIRLSDLNGGTTFAEDVAIDHNSYDPIADDFRCWYTIPAGVLTIDQHITAANVLSVVTSKGTFTNWSCPTVEQIESIKGLNADIGWNFPPFNKATNTSTAGIGTISPNGATQNARCYGGYPGRNNYIHASITISCIYTKRIARSVLFP